MYYILKKQQLPKMPTPISLYFTHIFILLNVSAQTYDSLTGRHCHQ